MQRAKAYTNEKGSTLVMAIVVLAAISVLGVTMITLSTNELDMATNEKVKELAKYNCDTCTVSINKLVRLIVDQSNQGILGINPDAGDSLAPGIEYAEAEVTTDDTEEFAKKVLFGLEKSTCEDVWLSPGGIADAVYDATDGDFTIYADEDESLFELDSAADIVGREVSPVFGTASQEHAAGMGHGLGEGGAGGGGMQMKFVIACRGKAKYNALHVNYSVYRKILGKDTDDK